jgi:hypothetical protein
MLMPEHKAEVPREPKNRGHSYFEDFAAAAATTGMNFFSVLRR